MQGEIMKVVRRIIEIDEERCDGCGQCVPSCAEGALSIVDGKARVASDNLCDGLGACLGECPNDALHIVEREAEEFDEAAVDAHLRSVDSVATAHNCPSSAVHVFVPSPTAGAPSETAGTGLSHWPVQITLIPPDAPYLKNAELLVVADCTPLAYPSFHGEFMKGKAVAMGCPKLDDAAAYVEKFTQIFRHAGISRVTTVIMDVPCCSGLPMIVAKALAASQQSIPVEEVVISRRGRILSDSREATARS
jgi:Fe-S-cluster-containing hydrogenase component 2